MTGAGTARVFDKDLLVDVTIRSVNHRMLDIKCRLPQELEFLESKIDRTIRAHVERGRIDVNISIEHLSKEKSSLEIDEHRVNCLLDSIGRIESSITRRFCELSWGDLLSVPGVVVEVSPSAPKEQMESSSLRALEEAISELVSSKRREGSYLVPFLKEMLNNCSSLINAIGKGVDSDVQERFFRFTKRVDELFSDQQIDRVRLYQELALLVERSDIKEERDRLKVHVGHFSHLCMQPGCKGRKLDFLCQEMLRESNTLLSKSFDQACTIKAIELKAEIERIREQVQNIE